MEHIKRNWVLYLVLVILIIVAIIVSYNWESITNYFKGTKVGDTCTTADGKDGLINPAKECVPLTGSVERISNTSGGGSVQRWNCFGAGYAYHSSVGCKSNEWGYYQN